MQNIMATGGCGFIASVFIRHLLLEVARHNLDRLVRSHHVSTDEVIGSLDAGAFFTEQLPDRPNSPYSASKAASDHLVRAYFNTCGLPVTISNCSHNYGPYQFPEKLIPLMILNALGDKPLPVYADGRNMIDWLHLKNHCRAVWVITKMAPAGRHTTSADAASLTILIQSK